MPLIGQIELKVLFHTAKKRVIKRYIENGKMKEEDIEKLVPSFKDFIRNATIKVSKEKTKMSAEERWKLPPGAATCHAFNYRESSLRTEHGEKRCMARVWNAWCSGQCQNKQKETDLCGVHLRVVKNHGGELRFGRIDEERKNTFEKKKFRNAMVDEPKIKFSLE